MRASSESRDPSSLIYRNPVSTRPGQLQIADEVAGEPIGVEEAGQRRSVDRVRCVVARSSSHVALRLVAGTEIDPARVSRSGGLGQDCSIPLDSEDDRLTIFDAERVSYRIRQGEPAP
jgi:hypothetical protein